MDPFNEKKLISTKEASEESGYHSDYLARLCREGKIEGSQIGRMWFVSRDSLQTFVKEQREKKREFAEALAREREREYRAAFKAANPKAPRAISISTLSGAFLSNRQFVTSPFAAALATVVILGSGFSLAQAGVMSNVGEGTVALFSSAHTGVIALADNTRVSPLSNAVEYRTQLAGTVSENTLIALIPDAVAALSSAQVFGEGRIAFSPVVMPSSTPHARVSFVALSETLQDSRTLSRGYAGFGAQFVEGTSALLGAYTRGVSHVGESLLALGAGTRDQLVATSVFGVHLGERIAVTVATAITQAPVSYNKSIALSSGPVVVAFEQGAHTYATLASAAKDTTLFGGVFPSGSQNLASPLAALGGGFLTFLGDARDTFAGTLIALMGTKAPTIAVVPSDTLIAESIPVPVAVATDISSTPATAPSGATAVTTNVFPTTNTFISGVSKEYVDAEIARLSALFNRNLDNIPSFASRSSSGGSATNVSGGTVSATSITGSSLTISGNTTLGGTLAVTGNVTLGGTLTLSGVTGAVQCLHVDALGVISGTGADCGVGGSGLTSLNGLSGASQTFATSTDTNITLTVTSTGTTHTFTPGWTGTLASSRGGTGLSSVTANGLLIGNASGTGFTQIATSTLGLTTIDVAEGSNLYYTLARVAAAIAGTTTDALSEGSTNQYYTNARARAAFSSTVTGLTYTSGTGVLSLTSGYGIPLTASSTQWNDFYTAPSNRITAGTNLSWSGNTLNGPSDSYVRGLISAVGPLSYNSGTGSLSIPQASSTADGYLAAADFAAFNAKQAALAFTYPIQNSGNTISLAFGTTTANTWSQTQRFTGGASTTQLSVSGTAYFGSTATSTFDSAGNLSLAGLTSTLLYANSLGVVSQASVSSPLTFASGSLSVGDAAADGTIKGIASFTANDFDATSGNVSIDYTNGQKASASQPGFLTATDWNTFNGKFATTSTDYWLTTKSTSNLSEGANLYYTPTRVASVIAGTTTDALAEGSTNLYYTAGRVQTYLDSISKGYFFGTTSAAYFLSQNQGAAFSSTSVNYWLATKTTDNLTEGATNQYYTDIRARGALSSSATGLTYTSGTGVFSLTSGYNIPLTASTTDWNTAYNSRISSATYPVQFSNNVISLAFGTTSSNTWGGTQTFTNAPVLGTLSGIIYGTSGTLGSVSVSSPLSFSAGTLSIQAASASQNGYLSSTDWATFNSRISTSSLALFDKGYFFSTTSASYFLAQNLGNAYSTTSADYWLTTKSTTNLAEGSNLYYTDVRARAAITESITGVDYNTGTGVFSLTAGYTIPLSASTTEWASAYLNRITSATYPLQISSNVLSLAFGTTTANSWSALQQFNGGASTTALTVSGSTFLGTAGGFVGIGTTAPTYNLHVVSTTTTALFGLESTQGNVRLDLKTADGNYFALQRSNAGGDLKFQYNGTSKVTFLGNGNVGIGTTLPGAMLTVASTTPTANLFTFTAGTTSFVMTSAGLLGIATTTPSQALSVQGSALFSGNLSTANLTATGTATIGTLNGLIYGNSGVLTVATISAPLSFTAGTLAIAQATTGANGYLSSTDFAVFNNKISSTSLSASGPLAYNSSTGAFTISQASLSTNGYLSSSDFTTFNNKISSTSLSSTATGLTYTSATGVFSLTAGYTIPLTASTTEWGTAYANRITSATYPLQISSNVLSLAFGTTTANSWSALQTFTSGVSALNYNINNTGGPVGNGLYAPTGNTIALSTNSTERLRVDSVGRIGIGTTSPSQILSVQGNGLFSGNVTVAGLTATGTANINTLTLTNALTVANGGTGITSYTVGDLLYADTTTTLAKLPIGTAGQVLKVAAGFPSWGADQTVGAGGGDGVWATSTSLIYPQNTSDTVLVGTNSTSTSNSIFEVNGQAYVSSKVGIATTSPVTTLSVGGSGYFTGGLGVGVVNTTAGTFQTSGNATIGGSLNVTGLSGLVYGNGGTLANVSVSAPLSFSGNTLSIAQSSASVDGYLSSTDWNAFNSRISTSTLGLFDKGYFFSTTSVDAYLTTKTTSNLLEGSNLYYTPARVASVIAGTTTDALAEGATNLYYTDTRARGALSSSATGLTYTSATGVFSLTAGYTIPLTASTTEWGTAYNSRITSATYPLQISSNVLSLAFGTTTANSWSALQQFNGNASTTGFTSTGATFLATAGGNVGVGTTSPQGLLTLGSGQLTVPNGTVTSPSIAFNDDLNTGIYKAGSDQFYFTAGGAAQAGVFTLGFLVPATKGMYLDGGGNTYLSEVVADTVNVVTGGSERLRISATGNVGIATTTPSQTLSVQGSALFSGNLSLANLTATGTATIGSLNGLIYGNSGVLTAATVSAPLSFSAGTLAIAQATTGSNGYLSATDFTTFNNKISSTSLSAAGPLAYNSSTGAFTISQSSLSTNGYLSSSDFATFNNKISSTSLSSSATGLTYTSATGVFSLTAGYTIPLTASTTEWASAYTNRITSATYPLQISSNVLSLAFGTTTTNTWSNLQTFTSGFVSQASSTVSGAFNVGGQAYFAGNVGVGTTNPQQALHISTASNYQGVFINGNSAPVVGFARSGTLTPEWKVGVSGLLGTTFAISKGGSTDEKLVIDTNGNVGIGSTSPYAKLSVKGGGTTTGINFQTTNSSNAPLFSILDSGNVGIGTTSPQNLLHVGTWATANSIVQIDAAQASTQDGILLSNSGGSKWLIGRGSGRPSTNGFGIKDEDQSLFPFWIEDGANSNSIYVTDNSPVGLPGGSGTVVGIGTSTPIAKLQVLNTAAVDSFRVDDILGDTTPFVIDQSGNVGIGTTTPSQILSVQGNSIFSGNLSLASLTATGTASITGTATVGNLISNGLTANTFIYANGSKQLATGSVSAPLSFSAGTLSITQSSASVDGYLSSTDWATFNSRISTSSLALFDKGYFFSTTSASYFLAQNLGNSYSTTSADYWLTTKSTTNLLEGSNLYYTPARVAGVIAGTTTDALAEGVTNLYYTDTRARGALSSSATGLTYTSGTGVFSLTAGYTIPLTASTTEWGTAYNSRITSATYPLQISSNVLSLAFGTTTANSWSALQQFNGNASTTGFTSTGATFLATAGGNVGVGTTTPGALLDVNGTVYFGPQSTIGARGSLAGTAGAYQFGINGVTSGLGLNVNQNGTVTLSSSNQPLIFNNAYNSSEFGRFTVAGNFGIGSTSPAAKLSVQGSALFSGDLSLANLTATGTVSVNTLKVTGVSANILPYINASNNLAASTISAPLSFSAGTLAIAQATTGANGYLSATDFTTFNNKISSTSLSASGPLAYNSSTGAFTISQSSLSTNGYLSSSDFTTFNNKISSTSLSSSATGLTYTSATGVFSLTAGYTIPLTASTTEWGTAYTSRISSATAPLSITGNVLSLSQATASTNGYLSSTDFTTFNNKLGSTSLDTSLELATLITDETGSGSLVFSNSPVFSALSSSGTISINNTTANNFSTGFNVYKRGATGDSSASVASGAELGYNSFYGWDGAAYGRGAYIYARTAEAWSGTAHGARLQFSTTEAGGLVEAIRLTIDHNGYVGVGTTTPGALFSVAGASLTSGTGTFGQIIDLGLTANTFIYANGSKQFATGSVSAPLSFSTGTLSISQSSVSTNGYLSSTDFATFNNKISSTSLSSSATGLTYTSATGVFSLTAGYTIPLTASTTEWGTAYTNRITSATYPLQISSNVLSLAFGTTTTNTWSNLQTLTSGFISQASSTISDSLSVGGFGYFAGKVGIGSSSVLTTGLAVVNTSTSTSGTYSGADVSGTTNAGSQLTGNLYGLFARANTAAGSANSVNGELVGVNAIANHSGQATQSGATAIRAQVAVGYGGTGSVGNTLTTATGIYIANPSVDTANSSSLGYTFGLYLDNQTAGTETNYTIYSAGGMNYFGGTVAVASSSASAPLSVTGNAGISGTLYAGHLKDLSIAADSLVYADAASQLTGVTLGTGLTFSAGTLSVDSGAAYSTTSADYWLTTKSTTNLAEGTNLYYTDARARAALSSSATGLTYTSGTGVFSLTAGYTIPLTASTTEWGTAYTSRITSATYPLQISSNVLSLAFGTTTTNTWSNLQTFTSGFATAASSTIGGALNVSGNSWFGGNVGIGTSTPYGKLSVTDTNGGMVFSSTDGLGNANTPTLRILRNASSGTTKLELGVTNTGSTQDAGIWAFGTGEIRYVAGTGNFFPTFYANGSEAMRISSAGNVGVGTTTPDAKLVIAGTGQATTSITTGSGNLGATLVLSDTNTGGASGSGGMILFGGTGSGGNLGRFAAIKGLMTNSTSNSVGDLAFSTRNATGDATLTERLRIASGGNIGIGTTSPYGTLSVAGTSVQALVLGPSNGSRPYIDFNPQGIGSSWKFGHGLGNVGTNGFALMDGDANTSIINVEDGSRANALTIRSTNAAGTVGIGTTTPFGQLSVTGLGAGTGYTFLTANSSNVPTFAVLDNGYVGIGTTSPSAKFSIGVTGDTLSGITSNGSFIAFNYQGDTRYKLASNGNGELGLPSGFDGGALQIGSGLTGKSAISGGASGIGKLSFFTNNNFATAGMTLTGTGLGIATGTPAQALSVQGNGLFSGNVAVAGLTATGTIALPNSSITNAFLQNSSITVSNGGGLTVSGSPVSLGGTLTLSLNTGNGNTWTGLQQFNGGASTTAFSAYNGAYFGATATSSFSSTGVLTLNNVSANSFIYANGNKQIVSGTVSAPLSFSAGTLSIALATSAANGYLSSGDWTIFNNKLGSSTISSLTTNYLPKWNGSAFVNSQLAENGTNVGIGTTSSNWLLQVAGTRATFALSDSSAGTNLKHWLFTSAGGNLYIGTSTDVFATSTPAALTLTNSGNIGVGTTSPYAKLSVTGATAASYFNADSATATSTFAGGFSVGNGALQYDYSSGQTSIDNLALGALSFDADSGQVSWIDMPVTAAQSAGTVESYTAQLNGNPVLTVYGLADGVGGMTNLGVGIATTSPSAAFTVWAATSTASTLANFVNSASTTVFQINSNGNVGVGTTTPGSTFAVTGNALFSGTTTAGNIINTGVAANSLLYTDAAQKLAAVTVSGATGLSFSAGTLSLSAIPNASLANSTITISNGGGLTVSGSPVSLGGTATVSLNTANANTWTALQQFNAGASSTQLTTTGNTYLATLGGNVGIGTTSPSTLLHLEAVNPSLTLQGNTAIPTNSILFKNSTGITYGTISQNINSGEFKIGNTAGSGFYTTFYAGNATEKMRIDTAGNVGIGTTSPNNKLHISDAAATDVRFQITNATTGFGASDGLHLSIDSVGDAYLIQREAANLKLYTNNTPTSGITINSSGNVGVGTTTPSHKLDVYGTARFNVGTNQNIRLGTTGGNAFIAGYNDALSSFVALRIYGSSILLNPDAGGVVGIGTTTPSTSFAVQGNALFSGNLSLANLTATGTATLGSLTLGSALTVPNGGTGSTTLGGILVGNGTSAVTSAVVGAGLSWDGTTLSAISGGSGTVGSGTTGQFPYYAANGTTVSATSSIFLAASGNVGVGTAAPAARFEVSKSSTYSAESTAGISILSGASDSKLVLGADGANDLAYIQSLQAGTSYTTRPLAINPNGGSVGIGNASPLGKLDVSGNILSRGAAVSYTGITNAGVLNYDTVGGTLDLAAYSTGGNTSMRFTTSNAGTPGTRMTITSAGNVGIGAVTPGARLDVTKGAGALPLTSGSATNASFRTYSSSNESLEFGHQGASPWGSWIQSVDSSNHATNYPLLLNPNGGSVGIGTTSPQALLHVDRYNSAAIAFLASRSGAAPSGFGIDFNSGYTRVGSVNDFRIFTGMTVDGSISAGTERLTILASNGNVGIGTSTPGSALSVNGGVYAATSNGTSMFRGHQIGSGYSFGSGIFQAVTDNATGANNTYFQGVTAGTTNFSVRADGQGYFAGNVGIGTTSPYGKLSVTGSGTGAAKAFVVADSGNSEKFSVTDGGNVNIGPAGGSSWPILQRNSSTGGLTVTNSIAITSTNSLFRVLTSASSELFTVLQSGNVGIGTTTPGSKLTIDGTTVVRGGTDAQIRLGAFDGSGEALISAYNDALSGFTPLRFYGSEYNFLSGNVGIGTTSPSQKLEVSGGSIQLDNNQYLKSRLANGTSVNIIGYTSGNLTQVGANTEIELGGYVALRPNGAEAVRVTGAGNVGIGTTTPATRLQVLGTDSTNGQLRVNNDAANYFSVIVKSNGDTQLKPSGTSGLYLNGTYSASNFFNITDVGSLAQNSATNSYFTGAGNVGIGTTSPYAKLSVAGDLALTGGIYDNTASRGTNGMVLQTTGTGVQWVATSTLGFASAANAFIQGGNSFGATAILGTNDANDLQLETNGATKLTILSGGNVGIGSTSPYAKLSIVDGGGTNDTTLALNDRFRFSGDGVMKWGTASNAGILSWDTNVALIGSQPGNDLVFLTNGTSLGAEKMRITTGGNVGIGTTSPQSNVKLDVHGRIVGGLTHVGESALTTSSGEFWLSAKSLVTIGESSAGDANPAITLYRTAAGYSNGRAVRIYSPNSSGVMQFQIAGAGAAYGSETFNTVMQLTTAGYVNIGTTTAQSMLAVQGTGGAPLLNLYTTAGASVVTVNSAGSLGVGTTTPTEKVSVLSADNTQATNIFGVRANNLSAGIGIGYDTIRTIGTNASNSLSLDTQGTGSIGLKTGGTSRLTIFGATGYVGIGTTSPSMSLTVEGGDQTTARIRVSNSNIGSGGHMFDLIAGQRSVSQQGFSIFDATAGSTRLSIDNSGNVGIGTTSPTTLLTLSKATSYSSDPTYALHINGGTNPLKRLALGYDETIDASVIQSIHSSVAFKPLLLNPSGGNVGIGTTTPNALLTVSGTSNGAIGQVIENLSSGASASSRITFSNPATDAGSSGYIDYSAFGGAFTINAGRNNINSLNFQTQTSGSAQTRMTITNAGNVGIGTTSPDALLTLNSGANATIARFSNNNGSIFFNGTSGTLNEIVSRNLANIAYSDFAIRSQAGPQFTVSANGNVGIGTTTPDTIFSIFKNDATANPSVANTSSLVISNPNGGVNTGSQILFRSYTGTNNIGAGISFATNASNGTGTNGDLIFSTKSTVSSSLAEAMRVAYNGNVGIGTTSPYAKLSIHAAAGSTGTTLFAIASSTASATTTLLSVGNNGNLYVWANTNLGYATDQGYRLAINGDVLTAGLIRAGTSGNATAPTYSFGAAGATDNGLFLATTDQLGLSTAGTERLRIDASGNVGVGTTSPSRALSVQGNALFSGNLSLANLTATGTASIGTLTLTNALTGSYGGTGSTTLSGILAGNGTSGVKTAVIGSGLTWDGTTLTSTGGANYFTNSGASTYLSTGTNLGVGSSTPYARLSITGAGLTTGVNFQTTNSNNVPLFSIFDNGKVGIGTSSPQWQLSISGTTGQRIKTTSDTMSAFGIENAAGTTVFQVDTLDTSSDIFSVASSTGANYFNITSGGNIGIGTTTPGHLLTIAKATGPQLSLTDGSATSNPWTMRSINGNLYIGTSSPSTFATSTIPALTINSAGTVLVGNGLGKLTIGTLDPVYTVNGVAYATYVAGMIGQKEEVTGTADVTQVLTAPDGSTGYGYVISFDTQAPGSDLWLFAQATEIRRQIDKMVVLLSAEGGTKVWYSVDRANRKVYILSDMPTRVSYRLTAPRFDSAKWTNYNHDGITGFQPNANDQNSYFSAGPAISFNGTNQLTTLIGQLAKVGLDVRQASSTSGITIAQNGNVTVGTVNGTNSSLTVGGNILASGFISLLEVSEKVDITPLATSTATTTEQTASSTDDMLTALRSLTIGTFLYENESASTTKHLGFVSELPELVRTTAGSIDLYKLITVTVASVQALADKVEKLTIAVSNLAQSFTTNLLTAKEVHTDMLCVQDVCVTKAQLAAMLANASQQSATPSAPAPTPETTGTTTPTGGEETPAPTPSLPPTPEPTPAPEVTVTPEPTPAPEVTVIPEPTPTPEPAPAPAPDPAPAP